MFFAKLTLVVLVMAAAWKGLELFMHSVLTTPEPKFIPEPAPSPALVGGPMRFEEEYEDVVLPWDSQPHKAVVVYDASPDDGEAAAGDYVLDNNTILKLKPGQNHYGYCPANM